MFVQRRCKQKVGFKNGHKKKCFVKRKKKKLSKKRSCRQQGVSGCSTSHCHWSLQEVVVQQQVGGAVESYLLPLMFDLLR